MIHDFSERGHRADFDTIATIAAQGANSKQFLDSAQIDHNLGLPDSILEPVEAVEPSGQYPGIRSVLCEKFLCIGYGSRLIQLERGHYVSYDSHNSPSNLHPSNVGHQWMLHGPACFERRQNCVGVHRRAPENFVSKRIRERVQDGATSACNRRLADTASAHRRLGVWNIQRRPLHVDGYIQNRWRLAVME